MSLYTLTTQVGVRGYDPGADLAEKLTTLHSQYSCVPENWEHIGIQVPATLTMETGKPTPDVTDH